MISGIVGILSSILSLKNTSKNINPDKQQIRSSAKLLYEVKQLIITIENVEWDYNTPWHKLEPYGEKAKQLLSHPILKIHLEVVTTSLLDNHKTIHTIDAAKTIKQELVKAVSALEFENQEYEKIRMNPQRIDT